MAMATRPGRAIGAWSHKEHVLPGARRYLSGSGDVKRDQLSLENRYG